MTRLGLPGHPAGDRVAGQPAVESRADAALAARPGNASVSIILAARNAAAHIDNAIGQIQAQTVQDYQVVAVDDASVDRTTQRLQEWARSDLRVCLLRTDEQQGVAASRNLALKRASADYVWFTDCDDLWSPCILQRLLEEAAETDADVVICGARRTRLEGTQGAAGAEGASIPGAQGPAVTGPEDAVRRLLRGQIQGHLWNKLFRRSLFDEVQFPLTRAHSDLGAMADLLARAQNVALLDEQLYTYVIRPGSVLNSKDFRATDLLDCRRRVRAAVTGLASMLPSSSGLSDDFVCFDYASVRLPALHEIIRRNAVDPAARAVRDEVLASIGLAELRLMVARGRWRTALAALAVRRAFPVYALAYRLFRRLKWGSVGYY